VIVERHASGERGAKVEGEKERGKGRESWPERERERSMKEAKILAREKKGGERQKYWRCREKEWL
jgi:hypothetical protein